MEEYVPRIFVTLLSIALMFIFPLVTSYERQDDMSYAYALKATNLFVDAVRNKGYISPNMYDEFKTILSATGNDYEITMERRKKTYYPIGEIYDFDKPTKKLTLVSEYPAFSPKEISSNTYMHNSEVKIGSTIYKKYFYENSYIPGSVRDELIKYDWDLEKRADIVTTIIPNAKVQYEVIDQKQLMAILFPSGIDKNSSTAEVVAASGDARRYVRLCKDDIFTVTVRNRNITMGTLLAYTFIPDNLKGNMSKIYINYGGMVRNEQWYKTCPVCNASNPVEATECINKDFNWSKVCPNCSTINGRNAYLCKKCGYHLGTEAAY